MKTRSFAVLAAAVLPFVPAAPAHAIPPFDWPNTTVHWVADPGRCSFLAVEDPTLPGSGIFSGVIAGGPVVSDVVGATISIRCTLQVGAAASTHAGADSAVASSGSSTQAAVLLPTLVAYFAPPGAPIYVCTAVTINGTTYYSNGSGWSTSTAASCQLATSQETDPILQPIYDLVDGLLTGLVDPVLCPVLATFFPPDGEPFGLWNCPPY